VFMKSKAKSGKKGSAKSSARTTAKSSRSSSSKGGNSTSNNKKGLFNGVTLPLGTLIPGGLGTFTTVKDAISRFRSQGARGALRIVVMRQWGIDIDKKVNEEGFLRPNEAHFTIGWVSGKANSWLIGNKLGINRALGRAKVPLFRV
jgi:hypothetical protein